ncbi:MAG: phytanoyl-CoA dioxygenase family protein [Pseudomonadota bacterium]
MQRLKNWAARLGIARAGGSQSYYTISAEQLNRIPYHQMTTGVAHDIYLMRKFEDERQNELFNRQLTENQRAYRDNGYLILRNLIPEDVIDRYLALREEAKLGREQFPQQDTPHVKYQCIRDIACYAPLSAVIEELHSTYMGLIFVLTGFQSTQRGWHQDAYLDPDDALPRCATWIALGDVDERCGPFELVPMSHRWPALSNQALNKFIKRPYHWPDGHTEGASGVPRWGRLTEALINPSVTRKIRDENLNIKQFTASKGDVLIWHGRLMHRGSRATEEEAVRPALIAHYAPLSERKRGLFVKRKDNSYFLAPPQVTKHLNSASDVC